MSKQTKNIIKWIFVIVILGLIVYVFRDTAGPILTQLKKTSGKIILLICIASLCYGGFESLITFILAREYKKDFKYTQAFGMTYFVSFYRVSTLGSGAGVSALVYLNRCGIEASKGCGMYMLEYAIHKTMLAIFSVIFYIANRSYMMEHFEEYQVYLVLGIILNIIISICLMLFACAVWFHRILYKLMDIFNFKGKFTNQFDKVREQCKIMEDTSKMMLKSWKKLVLVALINLVKFACWFGIPYIIFGSSAGVNIGQVMAITSLGVMLAAVIPTPAGIGSSEFMLIALFTGIVGSELAGAMSLLYRFATFVFPFLVGIIFAVGYKKITSEKQG